MSDIRRHILFDLDGTLTDPGEGICNSVRFALTSLGRPVPAQAVLELFIGPPLDESFAEYCGLADEEIPAAIEAFRDYFARQGIDENKPFPGMAALLEGLVARGRQLHIATTKPKQLAEKVLASFGLSGYFTLVCGSTLAHAGRPKAEVVAEVLQLGGIHPDDAVMVGDRKYDVSGAHAHGLPCIGVLFGYGGREELQAAGADALAEDVAELGRLLEAL